MSSIQLICRKPYLALMMMAPIVYGQVVWFGERAVDLQLGGHYVVVHNSNLAFFALALLSLLALLYRGAEKQGLRPSPLVTFLHVLLTCFCLFGLIGTLNAMVPQGDTLAADWLTERRGWASYLLLLLSAAQLFFLFALIYEWIRNQ